MAIIPHDLAQETVRMFLANEYPPETVKTQEQPVLCESGASYDVTAWPTDAPKPPFVVGGVYRFLDPVTDEPRTAHIVTEQSALVNGNYWHVSELPLTAEYIGAFAVDAATLANIRLFIREVIAWQEWTR